MQAELFYGPAVFAGFWRRLGAFLLDFLLLGLLGALIGALFFDQLLILGHWGRVLGFCIALAYFAPMNSVLGGGQTLGKRLLRLRVIGADGKLLSLPRSTLRFLPVGVPLFLNGAPLPPAALQGGMPFLLSLLIFGLGFSVVYLFIFNRPSRRSVHDLLTGSSVVASMGMPAAAAAQRLHLAVCGLLLCISATAPLAFGGLAKSDLFASLNKMADAVDDLEWANSSTVFRGTHYQTSAAQGSSEQSFISVKIKLKDQQMDEARARQAAQRVLAADASAQSVDVLQVVLLYGYDIGIASFSRSYSYDKTPAQWAETAPAAKP